MRINNVSSDNAGNLTTRVEGLTLTHTPDCALRQARTFMDLAEGCSCWIVDVTVAEFPDGTTVPVPPGYTAGNEAHIQWLRDELVRQGAYRTADARRILGLLVLSLAGWGFAAARGIWGF